MRRRGARQVRLNIHTMFIFPHTPPLPRADSRSQTQGLDSSFEFRKVAFINCFNSCVRSLPCSASLQVTEEVLSSRPGGRFLRETRLLRLLSAFGARFPTTRGAPRGTTRGRDDTVAPLQPPFQRTFRTACPPALLDPVKVRPLSLRRADSDSTPPSATPLPVSSGAFPLSAGRVLLASRPALLPHSCDWLVSRGLSPVTFTQWCFGCSSGKQVSMFVLFCFYPD